MIPEDWKARAPAMTERAWQGVRRLLQHTDAPRWNQTIGDRVDNAALDTLVAFRGALARRPDTASSGPTAAIVGFVEQLRDRLYLLDDLPRGFDVERDFEDLPTTDRDDLARRLEDLVPHDLSFDDAIVYSTSATTGHSVIVPSHPSAMVQNLAHLEAAAALHGVQLEPREGEPFALNITVQRNTYVFATTMSGWAGAAFAKINLADHDWAGGTASRARFLQDFSPAFVASEPVTLSESIRLGLPLRPRLVVSSAVHLAPSHAAFIERSWGTKVVDLYSMTETGPIAVTVPGIEGHAVLLPDLFIEALDEEGRRVPEGARGELTVTGGRNPLLPLIRYRTGDHGRLGTALLANGQRVRTIVDLEGRRPVTFRALDGSRVSSVDIARRIRPLAPFVQHALHQRADSSIELRVRPLVGLPIPKEDFESTLRDLFGREASITVRVDAELGNEGGKVVAWRSDLD